MYLWVVLTTFLAMIAGYFLPIRADTQKKIVIPVAQAKMMQLVAKQKAGEQYMRERAYPFYSTQYERKVNYTNGQISDDALEPYLPHGFINSPDYQSWIVCMGESDAGTRFIVPPLNEIEASAVLNNGTDACRKFEGTKLWRMLITFGPIPERWQAISQDANDIIKPSADLMEAMRYQFGRKEMFGYVIRKNSKLYVASYENVEYEIPAPVAQTTRIENDCLDYYGGCLAFMQWR